MTSLKKVGISVLLALFILSSCSNNSTSTTENSVSAANSQESTVEQTTPIETTVEQTTPIETTEKIVEKISDATILGSTYSELIENPEKYEDAEISISCAINSYSLLSNNEWLIQANLLDDKSKEIQLYVPLDKSRSVLPDTNISVKCKYYQMDANTNTPEFKVNEYTVDKKVTFDSEYLNKYCKTIDNKTLKENPSMFECQMVKLSGKINSEINHVVLDNGIGVSSFTMNVTKGQYDYTDTIAVGIADNYYYDLINENKIEELHLNDVITLYGMVYDNIPTEDPNDVKYYPSITGISFTIDDRNDITPAFNDYWGYIDFDGFRITFLGFDPVVTVDNRFSELDGQEVVPVKVNIQNRTGKTGHINQFYVTMFGSRGTELSNVSYFFDDGSDIFKDTRDGASIVGHFYLLYDGDGMYYISFDKSFGNNPIEAPISINMAEIKSIQ